MVTRQHLEKWQVLVYLVAIAIGLAVGTLMPGRIGMLEAVLWPVLALLLFATFTQVPLAHMRQAMSDTRFVIVAVVGNFLLVPLLLWCLLPFLPDDPAIRLGVLLVLLLPCTDWFITFTHLAGGSTKHAIAFSPISLLLQMVLLPVYLSLFLGSDFVISLARTEMAVAFLTLILLPLLCAYFTEVWIEKSPRRRPVLDRLAWFPVPLLAVVVFIIAATQIHHVTASFSVLGILMLVFAGYLVAAALLARGLASALSLPSGQGRVLAFSLGTRNSFVVLPLALTLPPPYQLAVVAIVFQSLVELIGMAVYLWWIPKKLFPIASPHSLRH